MPTEQIIVSYSELDTFRQCPLKHFLSYNQRWTKPNKEGGALAKGSLYHQVMELHYKTIKEHQERKGGGKAKRLTAAEGRAALDQVKERIATAALLHDPVSGEQTDVQALIEWMYQGYVDQYGADLEWKIIGVEHQILTPFRDARNRRTRYVLKAKIDLLVMEWSTGAVWVVDHKSGKDLPSQMDLEIDDQFGLYSWAMRQMGHKVQGAIHSANRTQRNKSAMPLDTRMRRTFLTRGQTELDNIAFDAYQVARHAHPTGKNTIPARYSSPDPRSCGWKCDFKEVHIASRKGTPMQRALVDFGFRINKERH